MAPARSIASGDHHDTALRKSQLPYTVDSMDESIDRVRQVIAQLGMSQREFATAIGLDAPKLSKALNGTRRFTSLDVAKIAEIGSVTVEWLLTGVEPVLFTAARRAVGTTSEAAVDAAARLIELRETADRLGHPRPPVALPLPGLTFGDRQFGEGLAAAAVQVVRDTGMTPRDLNLAAVIEKSFNIDVAVVDLGDGFDGLSARTEGARMVLASPISHLARQRFTLAHELGHLLAGDNQGVHLDQDIFAGKGRAEPSEVRANAFAAAFLMPRDLLVERVRPGFDEAAFATLAMDLAVSPESLAYRLGGLNLIDKLAVERYRRLSVEKAATACGRSAELADWMRRAVETRVPQLLAADLFAAYTAGDTTLRPYAALLGRPTSEIRATLRREDD